MRNCGSTYNLKRCGALIGETLDANPDIVGYGVLLGFTANTILIIGAIILGYLTKSLPEDDLTDFDRKTVEKVASSWIGRTSAKAWKAFTCISRRCLLLRPPNKEDDLDENERREALQKFVLTLSDQQLVTGIAILVACFINWCKMSVYELNIVVSLAWFSSSTHVATLQVLQVYFQRNQLVRNWRMIGMVAIVLLLFAGLFLTGYYYNSNRSVPIPCLTCLNAATIYDCNVTFLDNGMYYANNSYYNDCTWYVSNSSGSLSFGPFFNIVFTVVFLAHTFATALLGTIAISRNTALTPSHILVYLAFCIMGRTKHVSMEVVNGTMIEIWAKKEAISDHMYAKLPKGRLQRLYSILIAYSRSYLYYIGNLCLLLSIGLSQVATSRWYADMPRLQAGSTSLDFGQIVPLVLLVLPVLAAVEIFHEKNNRLVEEVLNKDATPMLAAIANSELHGDCDSHNIASSENEQVHVPLPDLMGHETTASTPDISHQLADSYKTPVKSTQSSGVQPSRLVGLIFFLHVCTSIAVGVLLNLDTTADVTGLLTTCFILCVIVYREGADTIFAIWIRLDAMRNNADEGIELRATANEPASQSNRAAQAYASADEALHVRDGVIETSIADAAPENSQEIQDDAGNENPLFIRPSRQDTEAGLRGLVHL